MPRFFSSLIVLMAGMNLIIAQETTAPPATGAASDSLPNLKEIAPGVLEFNGIRLEKKQRRITFPAIVNQREGLIEYLLVSDKGKRHESLLSTILEPRDIHLAMLLIGLNRAAIPAQKETLPPDAIDSAYLHSAPKLQGVPVLISVAWAVAGKRTEVPLEQWIFNLETNHPATPGPWTYNGSMIENGVFLADQELSIIAVITDPTALINNPRKGYDNDEIWQVRDSEVPALDTPVEVIITLPPSVAKP